MQITHHRHTQDDDVPFDLWLRRELHMLFDAVADEPIPPDLVRLVEQGPEDWRVREPCLPR
ncbi:hypothetical protein HLH34_02695 [Gluconacetobacter azotocaptans]|uniref:Anti-sigma factor NepR domain-containing protein n=1 Tax=Gluconacetobacter azotocaptans TaxID=142834 RepID=A0A7W4JQ70_9PROT|nr:hypothetical protein [Gluconacetobacter azotocaptans]